MNILGISDVTGNHSHACVALVQNGELIFALSEERLSRIKNDSKFPGSAIQALLDYAGLQLNNIDWFACGYPPARYYSSLKQRSAWDLPKSVIGVLVRNPGKLVKYLGPNLKKGLLDPKHANGLAALGVPKEKILFVDHHLAHVSAAFRNSMLENAVGVSYGGFAPQANGLNVAGAVFQCSHQKIEKIATIPMTATGCFVSGVAVALEFAYMQQEGKIMALAALGNADLCYEELRKIATVFENGSWRAYKNWVDYVMAPRQEVFLNTKTGRKLRQLIHKYTPADVAAAAQRLVEQNLMTFFEHLHQQAPATNLVLAGGIFNNIRLNSKLQQLPFVQKIFVHPFPGDGSTPLGAAFEVYAAKTGREVRAPLRDMGLGMNFSERSIESDLRRYASVLTYEKIKGDPSEMAAILIANGHIVGWFSGREEYGPRALGHRCILADPRRVTMKTRLTMQIKKRDDFIPLSVSCLDEHAGSYFENYRSNPFMSFAYHVDTRHASEIAAALPVDGMVRVQGVHKNDNPPFRRLLEFFYQRTGVPLVLNTSFNRHSEPIVHTPSEAIELLIRSGIGALVIENYVARKYER